MDRKQVIAKLDTALHQLDQLRSQVEETIAQAQLPPAPPATTEGG